jgi:alpha-amylase/alpha-mannosidase (GH57 family)
MADKKLNISFLWHMHQPLYKDPFTEDYILPWVLFHGTKDYYDMVAILDEYPEVHQTFNLVPSLIEQIKDYCTGNVKDKYRQVSFKLARNLTIEDKYFILERFFQSNWDTMIKPVARYNEMLNLRGFSCEPEDIKNALRLFKEQDYLDLQVLFNLSWIDPLHKAQDRWLAELNDKGRNYTEQDKELLLKKQTAIMRSILPKYAQMSEQGIVELTTSPYYHPILPLLCDTDSAQMAMANIKLPRQRFCHPEDAREQIKKALALHLDTFGTLPKGMWPSEGSVSQEAATLIAEAGIEWIATDEEILSHSLNVPIARGNDGMCKDGFIFKPYSIDTKSGNLGVVFRDKVLSDLIGFEYSKWDADKAVADFTSRLHRIRQNLIEPASHMVNIILDGENAWEYYKNDGQDFLRLLYKSLSEDKDIQCVTPDEFFKGLKTEPDKIKKIYSGSWINHNFRIWIGHEEDNAAWDMISEAREALVEYENAKGAEATTSADIAAAWEAIYAAEGSDWFWWYGDDHTTTSAEDFDHLFRAYLMKVYALIGKEHPAHFNVPIISIEWEHRPEFVPSRFMTATFDGEVTNYFEWLSAVKLERIHTSGAMHCEGESKGFIEEVYYGFNLQTLFLRLDYSNEVSARRSEWEFIVRFHHPEEIQIKVTVKGSTASAHLFRKIKDEWQGDATIETIAAGDIVELGIDFATLSATPGAELKLQIDIKAGAAGTMRWPTKGVLLIDVPADDYENIHWTV